MAHVYFHVYFSTASDVSGSVSEAKRVEDLNEVNKQAFFRNQSHDDSLQSQPQKERNQSQDVNYSK